MATATLTERGQLVIPAELRTRYGLTPGTQVEFVDDNGSITLVVRRRVESSDPARGYGMIKLTSRGRPRYLSEFDAAALVSRRHRRRRP